MKRLGILLVTLILCSLTLGGQDLKTYGDWSIIRSNDGKDLIAATQIDQNKFLAFRCFSESGECVHILVPDTACEDGAEYPILVNTDAAALSMDCLCSENEGSYEMIPTDYDSFQNLLRGQGQIGFAIPLQSGQFKVVRFSLDGAAQAMDFVREHLGDSSEYY